MAETGYRIPQEMVAEANGAALGDLQRDYESVAGILERRGIFSALKTDIDSLTRTVGEFGVAVPSWGVGTGGTRFGRFPGVGEPANVFDKMVDVATIHQLSGGAPRVSLHIPWDQTDDPRELREFAAKLNLSFDAMNSNTFQDQSDQEHSYKFGSLSHTDARVRRQAIDHNVDVIRYGVELKSEALTVWIGDGGNFPGQIHLRRAYERVLESLRSIYSELPENWRLFTEHKPYEPAFYSTVIQDWGTSLMLSQALGDKAYSLVDLGHHLPNANIETIVARLISAGKLGGFHFNDSKYGDDDLTAGSIHPYQLFLIFNELVDAEQDPEVDSSRYRPASMLDQSHNVKDPIEAPIVRVERTRKAYAKAQLVERASLAACRHNHHELEAAQILKRAFDLDVTPILRMARYRNDAAIDPIAVFRQSGYRAAKGDERESDRKLGGGIV